MWVFLNFMSINIYISLRGCFSTRVTRKLRERESFSHICCRNDASPSCLPSYFRLSLNVILGEYVYPISYKVRATSKWYFTRDIAGRWIEVEPKRQHESGNVQVRWERLEYSQKSFKCFFQTLSAYALDSFPFFNSYVYK